jgi:[protein-PII] uridylyltransferase
MHFHANSACDVLYRDDQLRIADLFGYQGRDGVRPVEAFMQDYFSHTTAVRLAVGHFVDGARWRYPRLRRLLGSLSSHRVDRDFLVGPTYLSATERGRRKLRSSLADVLRLMDLTGRYDCRIDHPTWKTIREAMIARDDLKVDQDAATRFLSFLSQPNQLGRLLRRLHELRVLGKLVPGFEHARCLLQFNEYHKFTVDEHSIQAVERATEFGQQNSVLGQAYRDVKQKQLLHLALLVHDLGKGFPEDHSEVGANIALQVAQTLYLSQRDTETLRFLVHRHLMLSHLAFRRDTSDESIIVEHAAEIGSPAILRMLFVLTCADFAAVGPGVFNQWKQDVLTQLYQRLMDQLSGGMVSVAPPRLAVKRDELLQDPRVAADPEWFRQQIIGLPAAYLDGPTQNSILADLARLRVSPRTQPVVWARYLPERNAVEYSVGVYEDVFRGIFHRVTGALTGQGLEILAAEIHSLADHLCLDRFYVQDGDYRGEPPVERYQTVTNAIVRALTDDANQPPTFRRTWHDRNQARSQKLTGLPSKVRIDNTTSDLYTIIDVFAHDRPGLLYRITRTVYELHLSVATARIGTYLDQVVDVLYVADPSGSKIEDEDRLATIRQRLLEAITETD